MAIFKEQSKIKTLKEAGKRLARILDEVAQDIRHGVTERELDKKARELIEKGGDLSPMRKKSIESQTSRAYPLSRIKKSKRIN